MRHDVWYVVLWHLWHRTCLKPCPAMPSCAQPCPAVPSCAQPCPAVPSHAQLCPAMPSCADPCPAVPSHAQLCPAMPSCAQLCPAVPSHAQLCPAMPSCAQLCPAMPSCAQLCPAMPSCDKLCPAMPSCAQPCPAAVPSHAQLCPAVPSHAQLSQGLERHQYLRLQAQRMRKTKDTARQCSLLHIHIIMLLPHVTLIGIIYCIYNYISHCIYNYIYTYLKFQFHQHGIPLAQHGSMVAWCIMECFRALLAEREELLRNLKSVQEALRSQPISADLSALPCHVMRSHTKP